jgi:hypothetical protein
MNLYFERTVKRMTESGQWPSARSHAAAPKSAVSGLQSSTQHRDKPGFYKCHAVMFFSSTMFNQVT